jgi:arsenate reductase
MASGKAGRIFNVLFLCTGNSARSIMAEALLNHWGMGRFHAFSAGSYPKGQVHPMAIDVLTRNHLPTDGLRSKSWDEFAAPDPPRLDFVFTVSDRAAQEMCPVWPGQPMTAHWGVQDPAAVEGPEQEKARAFEMTFRELDARLKVFTSLRLESLDQLSLQRQLDAISGKLQEEQERAFNMTFRELDARLKIFTSLRLESLDQLSLRRQLDAIGRADRKSSEALPQSTE